MVSTAAVTWGIARRSLLLIPRLLSTFIPSLVMPVFFTIVFAGGFAGIANLPGFPAKESIDWFLPMSTLMGAGFAGITTGLGVARDMQIGFYDRLLVSPAPGEPCSAGPCWLRSCARSSRWPWSSSSECCGVRTSRPDSLGLGCSWWRGLALPR